MAERRNGENSALPYMGSPPAGITREPLGFSVAVFSSNSLDPNSVLWKNSVLDQNFWKVILHRHFSACTVAVGRQFAARTRFMIVGMGKARCYLIWTPLSNRRVVFYLCRGQAAGSHQYMCAATASVMHSRVVAPTLNRPYLRPTSINVTTPTQGRTLTCPRSLTCHRVRSRENSDLRQHGLRAMCCTAQHAP